MKLEDWKTTLKLDELNWSYFFFLYQAYRGGIQRRPIVLFEPGVSHSSEKQVAYPIAQAPEEMRRQLKLIQYSDLKRLSPGYAEFSRDAALWIKKMQAGSGSSLSRTRYLSRLLGISESEVRIGAKGTDLFIEAGTGRISIAEAQILQCARDLACGLAGEIIIHDMMSSETELALKDLWSKPSFDDPRLSYDEWVSRTPGLSRSGRTYQAFVPTLDKSGELTLRRKAPAGHAIFAVEAIRAAYRRELRPKTRRPLIAVISNGEDLSGTPDHHMIGYMLKEKIPIALITTDRTPVDKKGGMISLLRGEAGEISFTVFETAQAKEAGQERLFASLPGIINTNMALFNYDALTSLISREVDEIGEDEFMKIISPDLISNVKSQVDPDGVTRKYVQLEGAMGSTIMNLDRYWRRKHGLPLVHLINVGRMHRSEFFSPIKSAFDYFMQFHSDRFAFDPSRMRLKDQRPGELPEIVLRDPVTADLFYQDVQNILDCFGGASLRQLDSLEIEGQVDLRDFALRGRVGVYSRSRLKVQVANLVRSRPLLIEDSAIDIDELGRLSKKSA